jgi:hypothetical protein
VRVLVVKLDTGEVFCGAVSEERQGEEEKEKRTRE